jgi:hypothetical protein
MMYFATRSVELVICQLWPKRLFVHVIFASAVSLLGLASTVRSQDAIQFKRLILDAQEANLGKFETGTMNALVTLTYKGRLPVRMESQIQWDSKTRFWEYRISDPGAIYRPPGGFDAPLDKAPFEYSLRTRDKVITANSRINKIVIQPNGPNMQYLRSEIFEITPDPLWKVCCPPYMQQGRPWKEMLDKPMLGGEPDEEVRFEQRDSGVIRMICVSPGKGYSAIYDFSLPLGGNLVRFESDTRENPKSTWVVTNEWAKEGDFVRLERSKTLRGGKDDSTASMSLDIQVRSIKPVVSKTPMTLETIIAKMPKNVQIADLIRNRTYYADPKAKSAVTDVQLRSLSEEIKKGEFLK